MAISTIGQNGLQQSRILTAVQQPAGAVLQVVQAYKNDVFSTSSASLVDVTGLSLSITPSSTSSKILLMVSVDVGSAGDAIVQLLRNGTAITNGTAGTVVNGFGQCAGSYVNQIFSLVNNYLDSPASSSAITYKVQIVVNGGGATAYVNRRSVNDSFGAVSSIIAMEIAA